jgi:hypothetical protein
LAYGFLDEFRRGKENARNKMDFSKYVQPKTRAFSFRFSGQPSQEKTFCFEFALGFSGSAASVFGQSSRRMKTIDVANLSDKLGGNDYATAGSG